jgi:hypothetical protein
MLSEIFFENRAAYEIMWKNTVEPGRLQTTVWHKHLASWVPKATNTHTQNKWYILLFHCNSGCTNAPQCYVVLTLSVLLSYNLITRSHCDYSITWCSYNVRGVHVGPNLLVPIVFSNLQVYSPSRQKYCSVQPFRIVCRGCRYWGNINMRGGGENFKRTRPVSAV